MMIGMFETLRISRHTCHPSMPGSMISSSIKLGGSLLNILTASSPRLAEATSNPSLTRYSWINWLIFGSSSTNRILVLPIPNAPLSLGIISYLRVTMVTPSSPSPNLPRRNS